MIHSGQFTDKKILLLDKEPKTKNDRTWCFWEKENGFFEDVVYRKWNTVSFLSDEFSSVMDITPYQYKMIRGLDFYEYCFREITRHNNIEVAYGDVKSWKYEKDDLLLRINENEFRLFAPDTEIFNSIYTPSAQKKNNITSSPRASSAARPASMRSAIWSSSTQVSMYAACCASTNSRSNAWISSG